MGLDLGQRRALNPAWRLVADGDRAILHRLDVFRVVVRHPTPRAALVAAMLDGQRTLEEIVLLCGMIFGSNTREAALFDVMSSLAELDAAGDVVIPAESARGPIVSHRLEDFVLSGGPAPSRPFAKPIRCTIHPTNRCQTDCVYCYAERPKADELSSAEWSAIFDQLESLKVSGVDVTGGDPMARRDSVEILCDLVRRGILFGLSTKCLVTDSHATRLADAGFSHDVCGERRVFQYSVDSVVPEIADRLTAVRGFLDRACRSIESLQRAGISVRLKATLTGINHDQVEPMVTFWRERGVVDFCFSNYFRSAFRHDDTLWLSDAQKQEIAEACARVRESCPAVQLSGTSTQPRSVATERPQPARATPKAGKCSAGRHTFGILPDGKVVLCEQLPSKEPFVVGDLRRQSVMDVWRSRAVAGFVRPDRELFRDTDCYACPEFETCKHHGRSCFRDAYKASGNPFSPHPRCYRRSLPILRTN